jgi:hypothetical protein
VNVPAHGFRSGRIEGAEMRADDVCSFGYGSIERQLLL